MVSTSLKLQSIFFEASNLSSTLEVRLKQAKLENPRILKNKLFKGKLLNGKLP